MDKKALPGKPVSIWLDTSESIDLSSPLTSEFDVIIIGAGITGITTAFNLINSGLKIAIIEAGLVLNAVTGNTTGKLTSQHGLRYSHLLETFGMEKAKLYAEANQWAIEWVTETALAENIECDLIREPAHIYTAQEEQVGAFKEEWEACLKLGLPASILTPPLDIPFEVTCALQFKNQARFHPLKFLLGLTKRMLSENIQVYEKIRALKIEEKDNILQVETTVGLFIANHVVVATHYPIYDSGMFVAKLSPYRSYAMAIDIEGPLPTGMYISAENPLHSFRRQPYQGHDILIVGGEDHKVGQHEDTVQCYLNLENWARSTFNVKHVLFRWSTQDNSTPDKLPYIGESPGVNRIYLATGFDGWGMSNGIVAGRLIADLIEGRSNSWASVYNPSRVNLASVPSLIKKNVNVAAHYFGDRFHSADEQSLDSLQPGEAAIVQLEDRRVAAYCDEEGAMHFVSSACTHLGCQVHWNSAERSWDCPCHGSRFSPDGHVLHGPAVHPLEPQ